MQLQLSVTPEEQRLLREHLVGLFPALAPLRELKLETGHCTVSLDTPLGPLRARLELVVEQG